MTLAKRTNVKLERPSLRRAEEFLVAVKQSHRLHRNRVTPPSTIEKFRGYLKRTRRQENEDFFVISAESGDLAGVISIGEIVRGYFQSAPLGYYAFVPHAGRGLMREGLLHAVEFAFKDLRLHRLEANIQPDNKRSAALVNSLGFRLEGRSRKYLKISGRWRDHDRWAILREEWSPRNRRSRAAVR